MSEKNILVIKHGSLGDWIQATGAFKLIRKHHPDSNIIMLTQSQYLPLANKCGWFNEVWEDNRLPLHKLNPNLQIIKKLRSKRYEHVYDLQCSSRTSMYFYFFQDKVQNWYGRTRGCSHYVPFDPELHAVELSYAILNASGITKTSPPDVSWLKENNFVLKIKSFSPFVLFIPGASAKHPAKRWDAKSYAITIDSLAYRRIKSVLIGTEIDRDIIEEIMASCEYLPINLINKAHFAEIAELSRAALGVVGGDTGPLHLAAATNATIVAMFSKFSDPNKTRPWGPKVTIVEEEDLSFLEPNRVISEILDTTVF